MFRFRSKDLGHNNHCYKRESQSWSFFISLLGLSYAEYCLRMRGARKDPIVGTKALWQTHADIFAERKKR